MAVAARWAQAELGLRRVAILDWDVHHGNGTQAILGDDPSILFVLAAPSGLFYPGTGGPGEQGETLVNLPKLAAGTDDGGYLEAFERAEAAVAAFEPELLLVSASFDAHGSRTRSSELRLSTQEIFAELARRAGASRPARGRAVLEGGFYNLDTLPDLVAAALERLRLSYRPRPAASCSSASRREETPSFASMFLTCERTVCSEMKRRLAISSVPRCWSRSSRTSSSRAESLSAIDCGTTPCRWPPSPHLRHQAACDGAGESSLSACDTAQEGDDPLRAARSSRT